MRTNVVIAGSLPRLFRDIIQTLTGVESDINVSETNLNKNELLERLEQWQTDVVIVGCDRESINTIGHDLLNMCHQTRIIAVTTSDFDAVLYRLSPVSQSLGRLSTESLLSAIRGSSDRHAT